MIATPETIGPVERALWLRGVVPFTALRAGQVAALARLAGEETAPAGRTVRPFGGPLRSVRLLAEGRLIVRGADGAETVVEAPSVIGLVELLAGRELRASLVAESDVTLLTLDGATVLDLLEEEFALVVQIRRALGRAVAAWQQAGNDWTPAAPLEAPPGPPADLDQFVERMLVLHRAPMLRAFGVAVLATLLRDEPAVRLATGDSLFEAGGVAERLFVVADGVLVGTTADGVSFRAGVGTLLGENEALLGLPYAYGTACASPAAVLALDPQAIWDAAEDHFHVARAMLAASARHLLRLEQGLVASFSPPSDTARASAQEVPQ